MPVIEMKVLLEHNHAHLFRYCQCVFPWTATEGSNCSRHVWPKTVTVRPFTKMFPMRVI